MKVIQYGFWILLLLSACSKQASSSTVTGTGNPSDTTHTDTTTAGNPIFEKGADISWLTEMEAGGYKFYDSTGTQRDALQLLQSLGINSVRLRAWVNPAGGWCNTADVVTKAKRARSLGMAVMIDFHYSDSWADPGKQYKPAAWSQLSIAQLDSAVYAYTFHVLDTLKSNGVIPSWVQVGNETNDGMLWEDGRASSHMANFAALLKSGYQAVKDNSDTTKVIVHLSNGYDNGMYRWMFDGLRSNGVKWDVIGMSLYPSTTNWSSLDQQCLYNMNDMVTRYGTPVMICEVGMRFDDPADSRAFLEDIISKTRSVPHNMGLGVFYWEPECYNNWQGYTLGAFDNTGKPTQALDAFRN